MPSMPIMMQSAADDIGAVSAIPTTTAMTMPIGIGAYVVALLMKPPSAVIMSLMKGPT